MVSKFSSKTFYLLLLVSLPLVVGGIYLSILFRDEETQVQTLPAEREEQVLPISIQNATFSAVPIIKDSITSTRGFSTTTTVTYKGDNLLVLVNKTIRLPADYYPKDLININNSVTSYPGALLRKGAANKLAEMFASAKKSGHTLTVTSAYRSYASQQATFNYWVSVAGLAAASQISARAGHSQHQLGTAVDLSSTTISNNLSPDFGNTAEGKWLAANSYKYGYVLSYPYGKEQITGYAYEPWHFRYIGVSAAKQMNNLGWDLETYLQNYGVW